VPLGLAALLGLGLALFGGPLLGVHGVETALLLGVVLPPVVAGASARATRTRLRAWAPPSPAGLVGGAMGLGLAVWGLPVVILGLNGLRVPQCTPGEALAFVLAGPGVGVVLAAVVGVGAALVLPGRLAVVGAVLVPVASAAMELAGLWGTPAIFAYDHFAGWFPGTLYDRGTTFSATYLGFRAVTAAALLAAVALVYGVLDPDRRQGRLTALAERPAPSLGILVGLAGLVAGTAAGPLWGHASSVGAIVDALGAREEGRRCTLHAPRELDPETRRRLVADCDFRVAQVEARLGVSDTPRIRAFLFRSAGEKRRMMGAAGTLIAKPWRGEIYLQDEGWPHPVMHHEVAHVVAARVGRGPLAVAGQWGGLLPDPALIEGMAVALAFRPRGDLTPHQWSRALLELDELPPLARLQGWRFLLRPARDAYTVMGSFLRFVLDTRGADALRRVYRQGSLDVLGGLDALEADWHRFLRGEVPLPPGAMERAKLRFGRPSLFATACPHRVARLKDELGAARGIGDHEEALELSARILDIDPQDPGVLAVRAGAFARLGRTGEAEEILARLEEAPAPIRAAARELVADAAWARGERGSAMAVYRSLLALPRDDDEARAVEVKALGVAAGDEVENAVRDLLVRDGGRAAPSALAVHLARALDDERDVVGGLGAYLEARQLAFAHAWEPAADRFERALALGLPTNRIRIEALRLLGWTAYASGFDAGDGPSRVRHLALAEAAARHLMEDSDGTSALRSEARGLLDRVVYTKTGALPAPTPAGNAASSAAR